jgi:hypothetical protein
MTLILYPSLRSSASLILWCHLEVHDKEQCAKSSKSTFGAAVGDILDRSRFLEQNPSNLDFERLPIFALSSIYTAASALTSEPKALQNVNALEAIATLKNMLTHFSQRWLAGSMALQNHFIVVANSGRAISRTSKRRPRPCLICLT